MSLATLNDLLSGSQGKWLLVATFLLFFLPILLPLLLLLSFFALMLLLPLGCAALVGFLSWRRLRKPSLITIGDEMQGKLLHFFLVKSGFVHFLLSFVLVSQLARFVEWREIKGGDYEGYDEGSSVGNSQSTEVPKGGVHNVVNGGSEDVSGDVFLWYNPLASIFNAERLEGDESDSSISDAESTISDHECNEIKALEDGLLDSFYEIKALDDCFHYFKPAISDTVIDSNHDHNDHHEGLPLIADFEHGEVLTSPELAEDPDVAELGYISDLLIANDSDGTLSCTEATLFSEIHLELDRYESMYHACSEHADWISASHADAKSKDVSQMGWKEHMANDISCLKSGGKRSNASSISSILSTGSGSGSVSMMSSTTSLASSTSTWSGWSEDQSSKKNAGRLKNGDHKSSTKNIKQQLGKRSSVGGAVPGGAKASPTGRNLAGGWRCGERAAEREQRKASRVGNGGFTVQSGAGVVTVCNEKEPSRRLKGSSAGLATDETGRSEAATGSSNSRSKRCGGGAAEAGQGKGRSVGGWAEREGLGVRAHKLGVKRVNAELESSAAPPAQQHAQVQASSDSSYYNRRGKPKPNKVCSEPINGKNPRVNVQEKPSGGAYEWPGLVSSGSHTGDHVSNQLTSELEDVRERIVHDRKQESRPSSPAFDDVSVSASDTYPQFYQLLEFWRSIEEAFIRQRITRNTSLT